MTQSGQGEEPSARPAHEGIVLPSDGGEPLLPGMAGAPAPAAPTGGQAWGGSWGPEQQPPQPGQGWPPAPAQQWHTPDAPGQPPAANPGPLPPEGAPAPSYGPPSYDHPGAQGGGYGAGQQPGYGAAPGPYQQQPQHQTHQQSLPQPYRQPPAGAAPLPPADAYPPAGAPLPAADEGATQYIPPVQAAAAEGATQYLPPVPAATADEGATQYIPPVAPGALRPEAGGEETRYLGRVQPQAPASASPDAEATQYIPPYAAQAQAQNQAQGVDRQPSDGFDHLFRGGPAGDDGPAGATQQMPRAQQPGGYPGGPAPYGAQQPSYGAQQPSYAPAHDDDRQRGRSRVPLIAAIGVGIVVIGVGAGALLSGGGGKDQGADGKTVAATSAAPGQGSSGAADPARQQAVALDKLLADSGSSRATVIKSVADVKNCDNLDTAGSDLRAAAKQRGDLVTRLGTLSVDKLPNNGELTAALTQAWQASAAADNHYAAWADQAKDRKVCRKGHARVTGETQAGNRASGTASAQKVKAAALWNTIAQKYGLTQRGPTQL
ncbi:hypothetical protein [Streptomyces sp. NPDC007856]|uniref:hypothetical protein n=1 Tax=Streptomyces sp. NPDC007856 TaxID=3364781 RepID=UPI0036A2CC02